MGGRTAVLLAAALVTIGLFAGGAAILAESGASQAARQPARERPDSPPRNVTPPTPSTPAAKPVVGVRRFGSADARPRTPGALRLAAYNVENLFDDKDDPALSDSVEDMDMTKPEAQLEALAAAIRAIDADVLALTELESKDALLWFRDRYLADMGYEYVESIDAGDSRGIENGVLSRFPLANPTVWVGMDLGGVHPKTFGDRGSENWHAGEPLKFRRTPLRIDVEVPAGTDLAGEATAAPYGLTLFVVHHKSGRGHEYWREAEAAKVVELVAEASKERPGRNIAVLGDFNATPADKVLEIYRNAGLIDTLADRKTEGPDAAAYVTHASGRIMDFVLVTPDLASEIVPGSAFVYGTPILPAGLDYRSVDPPAGHASDHFPVVVDIVSNEEGAKAASGT